MNGEGVVANGGEVGHDEDVETQDANIERVGRSDLGARRNEDFQVQLSRQLTTFRLEVAVQKPPQTARRVLAALQGMRVGLRLLSRHGCLLVLHVFYDKRCLATTAGHGHHGCLNAHTLRSWSDCHAVLAWILRVQERTTRAGTQSTDA